MDSLLVERGSQNFKEMMNIVSLAKLSLALVVRQARAGHILATMVVSAFVLKL